ncbi:glypican-5-like, partial [Littorina saxatilis]
RIAQLVSEAQNRTSVSLTRLHKVPVSEHEAVVSNFFTALHRSVQSDNVDTSLDDIVRDFFTNLFPAVFNFVLSVQGQEERQPISHEYHACLKRYADQIQPFGNQADHLLKHLRRSMKHSMVFQDALKTFTNAMNSTEVISMDNNCRHALVRLQVCAGCRGVSLKGAEVKPCRGMCLNVMRGCLAKISEISSSWDELVVSFENLQVGMMGHYELQRMLMYMDMNISEAIMMAMDDSARIYDEVKVKCQNIPREDPNSKSTPSLPIMPDVTEAIPARDAMLLQTFHQEVKSLVRYLEDSRGMFNRLADALCQNEAEYTQDMQSATCWNGTTVGR